jgi:hypothetical protein
VLRARRQALDEEAQAPQPLAPVGAQPEEQRRVLAPSHFATLSGASGFAHGSAYDAEIWPPFANEVSSAAPAWRSTSVTS